MDDFHIMKERVDSTASISYVKILEDKFHEYQLKYIAAEQLRKIEVQFKDVNEHLEGIFSKDETEKRLHNTIMYVN